jgi:hypothetical protein
MACAARFGARRARARRRHWWPATWTTRLHLEESTDGRAISATWSGSFADQACGKEIRGTWTDTATRIERAFVLRKQPGWQ